MAADTYTKILQTARTLFVRQGYTATSMRQVAEATGIGKATIYHHFPDKRAIVMALLQQNDDRMQACLEQVRAETDPRGRIQTAAAVTIKFFFEYADIIQVVRREVTDGRNQMQVGLAAYFQEYAALLADAIRRGTRQGIFRPVDPNTAARVLLTLFQGTFASVYLGSGHASTPEKAAQALLDVFFQGIDAR